MKEPANDAIRRKRFLTRLVRPIEVVGDVALVTLTKGQRALIDTADVHLVCGYNWYANASTSGYYAAREQDGEIILMHRLITGAREGSDVDHENRHTLDNRRSNLRVCTRAQNCANRRGWTANKTGFKGVWARNGYFMATIQVNKKSRHLGPFATADEASAAYLAAAREAYGEFAAA